MHEVWALQAAPGKGRKCGLTAYAVYSGGREAIVTVLVMARRKEDPYPKIRSMINAYCLL
jgi:hypothetical protein